MKPRVIALFGGSFNPPHVAHQMVALWALETQPIDEVWFVPVYKHVFGKDLASFEDRLAMTRLAAEPFGARARVVDAEKDNTSGRTYDLLLALTKDEAVAFRLLVGSDILAEAHKWHRWEDVIALAPLLVIGRAGHLTADQATSFHAPDISSTQIREWLKTRRDDAAAVLPKSVLRYIDEHQLYRDPT